MDSSIAARLQAPVALPAGAPAPVDFPPALATPGGARLAAMLERVPAFDWCHWGEALARVRLDEVAGALRFAPEGCARARLAGTDEAEIVLVGWLPEQAMGPGAHGESEGILHILGGRAMAQRMTLSQGTLGLGEARALWAGDQVPIRPEEPMRLVNPGPGVLVTLHLYAPRLG